MEAQGRHRVVLLAAAAVQAAAAVIVIQNKCATGLLSVYHDFVWLLYCKDVKYISLKGLCLRKAE